MKIGTEFWNKSIDFPKGAPAIFVSDSLFIQRKIQSLSSKSWKIFELENHIKR